MSAMEKLSEMTARIGQAIEDDRQKVGGMSLGAMGRLGLEEMRQAVALDGSIADQTQTPLGMYGTLTPGEVSAARDEPTASSQADAAAGVQADVGNDPVHAAQRQAAANHDASRDRDGAGAER